MGWSRAAASAISAAWVRTVAKASVVAAATAISAACSVNAVTGISNVQERVVDSNGVGGTVVAGQHSDGDHLGWPSGVGVVAGFDRAIIGVTPRVIAERSF